MQGAVLQTMPRVGKLDTIWKETLVGETLANLAKDSKFAKVSPTYYSHS